MLRTLLKWTAIVVGSALLLLAAAVVFLSIKKPAQRPASAARFEATPARLARGKYVVEALADCMGCHSDRDYTRWGAPVVEARRGVGGAAFNEANSGVPGVVCAQNITSDRATGLGAWTDGEIARAIREGVDRHGDALFPMMPYAYYHAMSDEDVEAVVVYLRTLPPIANAVPPKHIKFPVSLFVKSAPAPIEGPVATPNDATDHLAYGKYLVTVGGCRECHTAHDDHGQLVPGRDFAGGWKLTGPWGTVVTANITPDAATFVGSATKEQFIARFKAFASMTAENAPKTKGDTTIMPWMAMSRLTEQDLGAMYDYLRTVAPIHNVVTSFPGPG
ncbi:MAG TPA: hypothetical protein VHB21_04865 [Minicystis sp.]|nr:hypothetical protein [Minicystis sp.]